MHGKQRNLLLFGAFCCLSGAGVLCGSAIAGSQVRRGEAESAWGLHVDLNAKHSGQCEVLWLESLADRLVPGSLGAC